VTLTDGVRAGKNRVVLNLNEMDTTGLGTLLFALAKLRKAGGDLALVNLKPSHIEVLMAARLSTVFEVFKEDQDAV
jgi:anti-sigma B factor antagonist